MEDVSQYVKAYRDLRDKKAQLEGKLKEKVKPIIEMMEKIEARLLQLAAEQGVNSFATEHGTAYKNKATYLKMSDWPQFLDYVRAEDAWDLLTRGAAKTEVIALIESGATVPGVEVTTEMNMGFRAPTKTRS